MSIHFIGVDAGGTQTRALLATETGEIVGVGRAAGANTLSSGTSVSGAITTAIGAAVHERDGAAVAGGVIAVAGAGATALDFAAEVNSGWRSLGLPRSPHFVPDVLAAYKAGTVAPSGVVLVAGTGSIAAAISAGKVQRRAGGHGWIVGDEGSAVWLGVNGIRAALWALDRRGPQTTLATTIPEAFDIDASDALLSTPQIVAATHGRPPAHIGLLAPLVVEAAEHGDAVAQRLIEAAADHLMAIVTAVVGDEEPSVIVLAGSLLIHAAPIRRLVHAGLAERWPAATIAEAPSGVAGAVALAITRHTGTPISDATLVRLRGDGSAPQAA